MALQDVEILSSTLAVASQKDTADEVKNGDDHHLAMKKPTFKIGLRFRVNQIGSIDTVTQTYHVIGTLDVDWEATGQDMENFSQDPMHLYVQELIVKIM